MTLPKYLRGDFILLALLLPKMVFGQSSSPTASVAPNSSPAATASRASQNPSAKSTPLPVSQQQIERLNTATEKLLARIQKEENDLYLRMTYFEKPDRLDPNSYASKEEVAQWQGLLKEMEEKHDLVAQLYANLGRELDVELKQTGANPQLVARFKQAILDGFPWNIINKKKQLITDFIDAHGKLLAFYEKNWGAWKPRREGGQPEFNTPANTTAYRKLREQILATGTEIEKQYKTMSE